MACQSRPTGSSPPVALHGFGVVACDGQHRVVANTADCDCDAVTTRVVSRCRRRLACHDSTCDLAAAATRPTTGGLAHSITTVSECDLVAAAWLLAGRAAHGVATARSAAVAAVAPVVARLPFSTALASTALGWPPSLSAAGCLTGVEMGAHCAWGASLRVTTQRLLAGNAAQCIAIATGKISRCDLVAVEAQRCSAAVVAVLQFSTAVASVSFAWPPSLPAAACCAER